MPSKEGIFRGQLTRFPGSCKRFGPVLGGTRAAAQSVRSFACFFITLSALFPKKSRI
jgi:hypothetical protein